MAFEIQTTTALRLANEFRDILGRADALSPQELADQLRKNILERCTVLRSLAAANIDGQSRAQVIECLKSEQRILIMARDFRRSGVEALQ